MKNVTVKQTATELVITVDLTKNLGPSKSGKTIIIGTTAGNARLDAGIVVGLNVYRGR